MSRSSAARSDHASAPALIAGTSPREAAELLFGLLLDVVRRHQPEIEPLLKGGAAVTDFTPELMARALQAQGIWFQLLSIAEQNAAMRRRRQIERERGREELRGTFAMFSPRPRGPASGLRRSRSSSRICASAR